MKGIKILQVLTMTALLGAAAFAASSCSDDDDSKSVGNGTVTGTVTDYEGNNLDGVNVEVDDVTATATTASDGTFTISDVPMDSRNITFSKVGYQTTSVTLTASKYTEAIAVVNVSLDSANGVIKGTVIDAKNNNSPLSGVDVKLGNQNTSTGADGKFKFEYLSIEDYELEFSKTDYKTVYRTVKASDFDEGTATLEVLMGSDELLPGKTADDLRDSDLWYYNEYRAGNNSGSHWDWSTCYMAALDFTGTWENQNEGISLKISDESARADLTAFSSYMHGIKKITADNNILTVRMRTHSENNADKAVYFGVQVIDLNADEPETVQIGSIESTARDSYADYAFDLSSYIGKEVVVAVGIYHNNTGNVQFVIQALRFANQKVEGTDGWLPGTSILSGWHMTEEMVKSTMANPNRTFTGISPIRNSDGAAQRGESFHSWRGQYHVGYEWALMPVAKDTEPFPSEGFLIKTDGNPGINLDEPQAYIYAKFAISSGSDKLTLWARTFGSNQSYFKSMTFTEGGSSKAILPTATTGSDAGSGCWMFNHDGGSADNVDGYAKFVYDLSEFDGQEIVVAFSIHKGGTDTDENKLSIRQIQLN